VSKKLTRLPGEVEPPDVDRGRRMLAMRPRRTLETWEVSKDTGRVVVTHPKAFGRLEGKLARALGAPKEIRRPLDEFGSLIWQLCDGNHTIEEIARAAEERFAERFEPAVPRTLRFVEILAQRRLVLVVRQAEDEPAGVSP
jgi:hypothetical protein